jgi:protein-S-isoprenylcysteine O-methyltransferase Ste14
VPTGLLYEKETFLIRGVPGEGVRISRVGLSFGGTNYMAEWFDLKVPPLLVWLFFAGGMFGVAYSAPDLSFSLPAKSARALGLGFVVLGGAIALAGVAAFRAKRTTANPLNPGAASSIVSSGIYRFTRNPMYMYLGFFFALAGWALFLSNIGAVLLLPGFVVYLTQFQIKPEERTLLEKFCPEYARYMTQVRRWV